MSGAEEGAAGGDAISALPPLRDEIAAAGLRASKALGQNFLLDLNLLDRIVRSIGLGPGDRVYEVGPGPGGLTRSLLRTGAEVVAVERDSRAIPILARLAAARIPEPGSVGLLLIALLLLMAGRHPALRVRR